MFDPNNPDTWSDDQVKEMFHDATGDLKKAADEEYGSDWHESCFAAVIVLGREMSKRGIKLGAVQ